MAVSGWCSTGYCKGCVRKFPSGFECEHACHGVDKPEEEGVNLGLARRKQKYLGGTNE